MPVLCQAEVIGVLICLPGCILQVYQNSHVVISRLVSQSCPVHSKALGHHVKFNTMAAIATRQPVPPLFAVYKQQCPGILERATTVPAQSALYGPLIHRTPSSHHMQCWPGALTLRLSTTTPSTYSQDH